MVMAENDGGDHQKAVVMAVAPPQPASAAVKSVWNIPLPLPDIVDGEKSTTGGSTTVMTIHTDYWPPLGESQAQAEAKSPPPAATTQPAPAPHQHKQHGSGNSNSSHKYSSTRHQKSGKRNPNGGPTFPVPMPLNQPSVPPTFPDTRPPRMSIHGNDSGRHVQHTLRRDPNVHAANLPNGRPFMQETSGYMNPQWYRQRPFYPIDNNIPMHQGFGPPFFGRGPGPIGYYPVPPPGAIMGPHPSRFVPHPFNPGVPGFYDDNWDLRTNIVKQIEYYFCDENLKNDQYLISLMDDQGWVPISIIAEFKRVKKMCSDINFILYALQSSNSVELQDGMVRRRDDWRKWITASASISLKSDTPKGQPVEDIAMSSGNDDVCKHTTGDGTESNTDYSRGTFESEDKKNNTRETPTSSHIVEPKGDFIKPAYSDKVDPETDCDRSSSVEPSFRDVIDSHENMISSINMKFSGLSTNHNTLCLDHSRGTEHASLDIRATESMEMASDCAAQSIGDPSDFASTFMLDEELELEQKTQKKDDFGSVGRIHDEDDEMIVNEQDVQRLVIVTQSTSQNVNRTRARALCLYCFTMNFYPMAGFVGPPACTMCPFLPVLFCVLKKEDIVKVLTVVA